MKCKVCKGPALIDVRRHNANFCSDHFIRYCREQVAKTLKEFDMAEPGDRLLVAVSGGKDSFAVWDILESLGYDTHGLYVGLGIGEYSDTSGEYVRDFAAGRDLPLTEVDLRSTYDYDVPTASSVTRRVPCSACGLSKRHIFDEECRKGGFDAIVTGHNLDDEAAVLYGNVLRWQTDYLGRQRPMLPALNGFPKKIKPLVRLSERETAAYCVLRGIDYLVEECPMAAGNKHLSYKAALNLVEEESPGSKQAFYFGFLRDAVHRFDLTVSNPGQDRGDFATKDSPILSPCIQCGSPTNVETCSFCRLLRRASGAEPVPVELIRKKY